MYVRSHAFRCPRRHRSRAWSSVLLLHSMAWMQWWLPTFFTAGASACFNWPPPLSYLFIHPLSIISPLSLSLSLSLSSSSLARTPWFTKLSTSPAAKLRDHDHGCTKHLCATSTIACHTAGLLPRACPAFSLQHAQHHVNFCHLSGLMSPRSRGLYNNTPINSTKVIHQQHILTLTDGCCCCCCCCCCSSCCVGVI